MHVNQCLDCRNASTASLEPVNYESYEEDVKRAAEIVAAISKHYTVTFFGEFLVNPRIMAMFRRCFPAASIAVIAEAGPEGRRRVLVASGFSL